MRFIDLFAGLGGFHAALADLGLECVFASEIDPDLRELYTENFPSMRAKTRGDIRLLETKNAIPPHDILCAGFPCQPFSKSGSQKGLTEPTQGTLFHQIVDILRKHKPGFVFLENVGNFERHDNGRTWRIVRESLETIGYQVKGTEHVTTGGDGLLSPHHLGHPHTRERFYIVGRLNGNLPEKVFPDIDRFRVTTLQDIVQRADELSDEDKKEAALTPLQRACINHWDDLLQRIPDAVDLPSFPIWTDELDARYPYEHQTPYTMTTRALKRSLSSHPDFAYDMTHEELLRLLPSYARSRDAVFPEWKVRFIQQNREWLLANKRCFSTEWISQLRTYPASLRKFEWNCNGEERKLWKHVLQFRPSGLRVKRYTSSPALIAMTSTQIPILGPEHRFLTRIEGLRLQGLKDDHKLPDSRVAAFRALGNAVHAGVVREIASRFLSANGLQQNSSTYCNDKAPSYKGFQPSSERASKSLARSKSVNTKCERLLRSALWKMGFRFRNNVKDIPGRPDIVFRRQRVVVFCDGDFWHGRDWPQRRRKLVKGSNSSYWIAKIGSNMKRDRRHDRQLRKQGWTVVRIWERDILSNVQEAAAAVVAKLH